MTPQEQYRIRELNGVFTIQKKRFIKQFRMFLPSKIVEQWEDVDSLGNALNYQPNPVLRRTIAQYESIGKAQTAMQQFIEGVKYHYPKKGIDFTDTNQLLDEIIEVLNKPKPSDQEVETTTHKQHN